jgi:hypothetical protein
MLGLAEADALVVRHLGDTPRADHSRLVAFLMRRLAETFAADADLWEVVGLCHDLDFFRTSETPSRHGLVTLEWLGDSIPIDAQQAIAAHDHRTGVQADTLLADMLKVADVIAVIDQRVGRRALCSLDEADPYPGLRGLLRDRLYLCDILQRHARKHGLPFTRIVEIVAPMQSQLRG